MRCDCCGSGLASAAATSRERILGTVEIERFGAGGEAEIVDRLFGADQALGDLLDLAGNRLGIATVDRHLGDRLDLGFQVFDLGLEQFVVLPRLLQVGEPGTAGFEVGLERLADPRLGWPNRALFPAGESDFRGD